MNALTLIWRDPVLRLAAGLMVMTGTSWASFGPFIALLAVETFQLGDRGYALVWAISTLVGVVASLATAFGPIKAPAAEKSRWPLARWRCFR